MIGRVAVSWVLCLAACSGGGGPRALPIAPANAAAEAPRARLFHAPSEADFWVDHTRERDLVVAAGVRLEVSAAGEITAAAWDVDHATRDPLVGALMVPARLGGGFVHWSSGRVFRSRTFTGPLERVLARPDLGIRGARAGRSAVLVFTDAGPRELSPGAMALRSLARAGVNDAAMMPDGRAAEVDVFGRVLFAEGDRPMSDVSARAGLGVRQLGIGERDLFLVTGEARLPLRRGGVIGESVGRPNHAAHAIFATTWDHLRGSDLPWGQGSAGSLAAAVAAGGDAGDGTAFGVVQTSPVRVDLRTGKVLSIASEWAPGGLGCQPVRASDALLFACTWERYQGNGGVVLRAEQGGPPIVERAFSDDGTFAAGDDGALAFLGSCRAEARVFDPEERASRRDGDAEAPVSPVICLRRGPRDWLERRIEVPSGASLVAWAPGNEGRAVALISASDPLPARASPAGRVDESGGVRVVRLDRDLDPWALARAAPEHDGQGFVDRRFFARADGSVDLWLTPASEGAPPFVAGATLDPRGALTVHPAPPGAIAVAAGGAFGVGIAPGGELFETVDHGRTYRAAGMSPVPPSALGRPACSALGCALGPVVRVGWGASAITPEVRTLAAASALPAAPARRLACAPKGNPEPVEPPPAIPAGARTSVSTGWGDSLEIARDASAPEPPPARPPAAATAAPTAPPPKKPPRASPAVRSTHTLSVRPLFSVRGPTRRINATDAADLHRRSSVTPLLGPRGDVELLVAGAQSLHGGDLELLVAGDRITPLGAVGTRRWVRLDQARPAGVAIGPSRALVLVEQRRRLVLEEHAVGAAAAPVFLGFDFDQQRRRPITLGRRDDGAVAVLVLDGPAPETAGAAIVDRVAASAGPVARLAPWSSLVSADDPACRADEGAFRALLVVDPRAWIGVDSAASPGLTLARQGLLMVRWGRERVCLEALDVGVHDELTRGAPARSFRLIARWAGEGERGAALRAPDLRQELTCSLR